MVWGARTDRRWTVPVACMLALPALWYGGLTMLLAVIVLRQQDPGAWLTWLTETIRRLPPPCSLREIGTAIRGW